MQCRKSKSISYLERLFHNDLLIQTQKKAIAPAIPAILYMKSVNTLYNHSKHIMVLIDAEIDGIKMVSVTYYKIIWFFYKLQNTFSELTK